MPLKVYKSSAGSGKTTTLVNEYLKITLKNPQVFKNVLAITFTNKAANEMKERVLDALVKLSSGEGSKYSEFNDLIAEIGLNETEIKTHAEKLLSLILHRYDEFSISTIDSFVHRVVRTFATDVKLPQNFEVVIDTDEIVPEIIEKLFEKIEPGNAFTSLMVDFVMKQLDDEKNYDPTRMLDDFIKTQLNEESHLFLKKIEHLNADDFLKIIGKINFLLKNRKDSLQAIGNEAMALIEESGLSLTAFYQGSKGIFNYFSKLAEFKNNSVTDVGAYVDRTVNDEVEWHSSKASPSDRSMIAALKDDLKQLFHASRKLSSDYWLYYFILSKIHQLALMKEIRWLFTDYTDQTQRVHISEFNKKINDQISGQPVPFIYERLGRKYQHFLIDEFQDTSLLQWQNLLPLLEESLASNNLNMLVGDTKQAIYRFRNGEVELFANLPKIYKNDGTPEMIAREKLLEATYSPVPLDVNFRSKREIVDFNNEFFESLKKSVSPKLQKIYEEHSQKLPGNLEREGGFVSIELIPAENSAEYLQKRLLHVQQSVDKLLAAGNRRRDICVLSRSNANAAQVASFLVENGHKVISPESLLLSNSARVRLIVSFLKLISEPKQTLFQADFMYNLLLVRNKESEFHSGFSKIIRAESFEFDEFMHLLEIEIQEKDLAGQSIYEIAEFAIRKLGVAKETDVFLLNFLDFINENQEAGMGRLDLFLEKWEKKKNTASVITPTEEDAISVMTIHKAKGLKFNNVIVDITQGRNQNGKSEFWKELYSDELPDLNIILLPIKNDIEKAGFAEVNEEEKDKTLLDLINVIYVAFTRAVDSLFIISHQPERGDNKLTKYLVAFLQEKGIWDESRASYEFGKISASKDKHEKIGKEKIELKQFISTDWKNMISVAGSEEILWELLDERPARSYGNLLHKMLSEIIATDDIPSVVQTYLNSGIIEFKESIEIQGMLEEIVNHPRLKPFYNRNIICKNESSIIDPKGNVLRPDRVVIDGEKLIIIDYKTGEKMDDHVKKISQYADVFSSLGYENITKFLVYVNNGVELAEV
ncbi:MAG TPA: UvrD-helicase domain-containing protein [Bacteroidales bacterium]